jgi:pyrroline-5-carboxylate reductase
VHLLEKLGEQGFHIQTDNCDAVRRSNIIILTVLPQQLNELLREISPDIDSNRHIIISVVSGVNSNEIAKRIGKELPIVRVMPTMAISIHESMTCIASDRVPREVIEEVKSIFEPLGEVIIIKEEQMIPATSLCACGIAFFLRAIRASSQGGIEIGFHSDEAIIMAAQTAKGAASLLLNSRNHPEMEIDKVTTPEGCTIAGLNEMEHKGFSSAMIRGILTSAEKAAKLYKINNNEGI